jgi:flagellar biosynthesis/type III secretory pathway chaperone
LADVLKLTRKRRIILTCIEEIDQALKPLKRQWLSAQDRSPNVAQLWNNLSCTLKQILDIDQRNQVLMRVQMHDQACRQMPKKQTACDSG